MFSRGKIFETSHFLLGQQEVEILITACPQQIPGVAKLPPNPWHLVFGLSGIFGILLLARITFIVADL